MNANYCCSCKAAKRAKYTPQFQSSRMMSLLSLRSLRLSERTKSSYLESFATLCLARYRPTVRLSHSTFSDLALAVVVASSVDANLHGQVVQPLNAQALDTVGGGKSRSIHFPRQDTLHSFTQQSVPGGDAVCRKGHPSFLAQYAKQDRDPLGAARSLEYAVHALEGPIND